MIIFDLFIAVLVLLAIFFAWFLLADRKGLVDQGDNLKNNMELTSSRFRHNGGFPEEFACDGDGVNPPLDISNVPKRAKSLALVLRDPDAVEGIFIHWILWNMDPKTESIEIDSVPKGASQGVTTNKKNHYVPPCPPSGTHRYFFTLYALDKHLTLPSTTTVEQLNAAMDGHVVDKAELMALYR